LRSLVGNSEALRLRLPSIALPSGVLKSSSEVEDAMFGQDRLDSHLNRGHCVSLCRIVAALVAARVRGVNAMQFGRFN
jgi:hypothetical protein